MQLAQPKKIFEFGLPSILLIPKGTSKFLAQFVPVYSFFMINIFLVVSFPQNDDSPVSS